MNMYDDAAGPTINFLDAGNSAYIKGVFRERSRLALTNISQFLMMKIWMMDFHFLEIRGLSRDFATSQYYKGYYGR